MTEHCHGLPTGIKGLAMLLNSMFGDRLYRHDHIQMNIGTKIVLLSKKPHLFYYEHREFILHRVIKLFLSKGQRPTANRILLCDKTTTIEQIECILMRCALNDYSVAPLFCICEPELLQTSVQDHFLNSLPKYINKSKSICTIMTSTKDNKIYQKLSAFEFWNLPVFSHAEQKQFFEEILCKNDEEFNDEDNHQKPLCKLIMSQNECVGKTYRIQQMAKEAKYKLVHVPINTKIADLDFIVQQMYSHSVAPPNKVAFHINVSSDALYDVNVILFKLLVLRYLTKHSSGESIAALSNHAFFVELPSKLSSLTETTIKQTLKHFHFITKSAGIIHLEIQDSLKHYTGYLWTESDRTVNELDISHKEMFVYKYLDALDKGLLKNVAPNDNFEYPPDWDYSTHPDIDGNRSLELIGKYCKPARTSLVFLKSYLQYMYQQLILLYTSQYAQNIYSEIYEYRNRYKTPQYHRLIADSLTKSGEQIACHMYEITDLTTHTVMKEEKQYNEDDNDDNKDDEKEISEATGEEEFFLVKYWAEPKTEDGKQKAPLVLLNQPPLCPSMKITEEFLTNTNDLLLQKIWRKFTILNVHNAEKENMINGILKYVGADVKRDHIVWSYYYNHDDDDDDDDKQDQKDQNQDGQNIVEFDVKEVGRSAEIYANAFSLLSYQLDRNTASDAQQWIFINAALRERGSSLDFYNFADDKMQRRKMVKTKKTYREDAKKQKQKLELLLKLCGGFKTADPKIRKQLVKNIHEMKENKGYALTFDNLLKIVAIFLRLKSAIPILIMGETGCGKTRLLSYMASVLGLTMTTIDVHGGYTIDDLVHDLQVPITQARTTTQTVLVFLDEINTSKEVGSFKEVVCDHSLKGEPLPLNLVIIAALNPYRTRKKSTAQIHEEKSDEANNPKTFIDDLDQEMSNLVYRVYPIPPSMKTYVWNFGYLTNIDEQQYISVMTETSWNSPEILCGTDGNDAKFDKLLSLFTDIIAKSQVFLRKRLFDVSVCSLRDVRRCNDLFKWFFDQPKRRNERENGGIAAHSTRHLQEAMILALTQCYYYRLNEELRNKYCQLVDTAIRKSQFRNVTFLKTIEDEQDYLVDKVNIPKGIALNRAFKENLFVMLVGIATKTATVIVGKPGSSKTLAMMTLQDNLSSAQKNDKLTKLGFDDYWVIPFQCSKLTEAKAIADKWDYAEDWEQRLKKGTTNGGTKGEAENKVIFFLDEVGLAEQSPYRPLKVLHKLLEKPTISFIGLSNWKLDAAKMNRCVLHNVLPPSDDDLKKTARTIMQGDECSQFVVRELGSMIPQIATIYKNIINIEDKSVNPLKFDFHGHRDFYSLVSYLKFRLQQNSGKIDFTNNMILIEAVLRNFGGLNQKQTEEFLFPRISRYILNDDQLSEEKTERIWHQFSPLNLIAKNIEQTRIKRRINTAFELRNIMMITDNTALFKVLFDSNILDLNRTNIIFGSNFQDDKHSNIYLYRTIDKVRSAMIRGDTVVLLKLEQLYDSLYDVLNQRYLNIDNQKFCKICIGGESINCKIHPTFKLIVVVPTEEAHHTAEDRDCYTPTAFLNRFEKVYFDIDLLQTIGIGTNKDVWDGKWETLTNVMNDKYSDHRMYQYRDLFAGYKTSNSIISKITLLLSCNGTDNMNDFSNECYQKLLKVTSLQYLIQDRNELRTNDGFIGYANLIDLLQREGVKDQRLDRKHKLLRVVTFDTYQMPNDFNGYGMKVFELLKDDEQKDIDNEDAINVKFVELHSFYREKDFYDYVLSFLDSNTTAVSTLIIQCDPIPNNNKKETIFTHYLHAQYLIEKAYTHSITPNEETDSDEAMNTAKNVVFLIYQSRSNPYPLLFSDHWNHLYCDALSVSDHSLFPEIQINDINIFDDVDKTKLLNRVSQHSGRIVKNNYISALNGIDIPTNLHSELERFKLFLDNPGRFCQTLLKRISRVLKDVDTGAEKCISNAFKEKLDNRGSFRSQVMQMLGKKIENELIHVLAAIFSNGNSYLYESQYDSEHKEEKYNKDDERQNQYKKLITKLWLELLSEPQIVAFKAKSYGNKLGKTKTPIKTEYTAHFPFSLNIHSFFMSFRKSILLNYKEKTPMDESGIEGQRFLMKELSQRLDDANMDVPITNLPQICVKHLLNDIVQLLSIRLGIKKAGKNSKDLIESVSTFLWQISLKLHEEYLGIKRKQKQQKEKSKKEERPKRNDDEKTNDDESSSEGNYSEEDYSYSDQDEEDEDDPQDEEEKDKDMDEKKQKYEDIEEKKQEEKQIIYEEQMTVQLHEIYASAWSNQKITLQLIDVLSCVKPSSLKNINGEWRKENIAFMDRFGQIMKRVLAELKHLLQNLEHKALKETAEKILSMATSFDGVLAYLQRYQFVQIKILITNWKRIHLSLICILICKTRMDYTRFIEDVYKRFKTFDKIEDLQWLIDTIKTKLNNKNETASNDVLQYLYQLYVTDFALVENRSFHKNEKAMNQRHEFVKILIDICSQEVILDDDDQKNAISLRLNPFSKLQTLSKMLQLTRSNDTQSHDAKEEEEKKEEKKQEPEVDKEAQNIKMELSRTAEHGNIDENAFSSYILSCQEQYLYYKYKIENEGKRISKIPNEKVKQIIKRLHDSFKSTTLDQLLAIANAKLVVFYFVRFISTIYRRKNAKFTKKGLEHTLGHKKRYPLKMEYMETLSELFKTDNCENADLISIKNGFQYFMLSSLWCGVLGPQRAMSLASVDEFSKVLNIDIMSEMKDAPQDNPFKLLCVGDDKKIFDGIEDALRCKRNNMNWNNDLKYVVFVVGSLFNHGYVKKGINDEYLVNILAVIRNISNKISQEQIDNKDEDQTARVTRLFTTLTCNSMYDKLKFKSKKILEDVQLIRMMYHFVGVVLSLPKSPFSILFHDPIAFNKGYVPGMPDDAASQLFKYFKNCAAWLCPNGHMYFIADCTYPSDSGNCDKCGAPTGKKRGNSRSHEPAPGNKRLGTIDANGKLLVDAHRGYAAYTEYAVYKPEENTPTGYVDVVATDACRDINEISLRIIRLFVNVMLLLHHCCDEQLSKLKYIPSLGSLREYSDIYDKILNRINTYTTELAQKLGIQSKEELLYVLHNIINDFYIKYPQWIAQDATRNIVHITDIQQRSIFETFLVKECIEPTLNDVHGSIQRVRDKCSNTLMRYWSSRVGETIDLQSDEGMQFSRRFKPNLFLQFRFVTLYQFQTIMLKTIGNTEKHKLKQLYPITYGILECIDLDIGYSVFALKYLPFMITWMRNIKLRLNQRIDMNDIIENSDTYTGQWVLDECEKKQWGDIDEWVESLNGFIAGWNHVASRVTVDKEKQTAVIDRQMSNTLLYDDHEDGKDDEKEQVRNQQRPPNIKQTDIDEKKDNADADVALKNPFRKYVVIADACQPITILQIKPKLRRKDKDQIIPSDVPLSFALDSSSDEFTSSKMIRFMLQHLVEANNRLLRICYNLDDDDNGQEIGLSPRLPITELSQQRFNDVINLDEEELTALIQQCAKPRLKYGEDYKLDNNSFNLRLLETQLKQKYIVNRKLLKCDRINFEFAGEHNIISIIEQINRKYKSKTMKRKYFNQTPDVVNGLRLLQFGIQQNCEYVDDIEHENEQTMEDTDDENERKREMNRKNQMRAYKTSMQAVEQTLIAISRLENYPHPIKTELSEYMKNALHLYPKDHTPFQGTKLMLQHMDTVWRYLEKKYILCEDKWTEIPNSIMHCYMDFISETQKTAITQFVASKQDMDELWIFLGGLRRFLQRNCKTKLPNFEPEKAPLKEWLTDADDIKDELKNELPKGIMMSQIGHAYRIAAEAYKQLLN